MPVEHGNKPVNIPLPPGQPPQPPVESPGKKTKAVDIQKQMESWMKQQKKTKNKPMSAEEANEIRKQKKLEQVGQFTTGSFGSTFQSKSQQQNALQPPPPPGFLVFFSKLGLIVGQNGTPILASYRP